MFVWISWYLTLSAAEAVAAHSGRGFITPNCKQLDCRRPFDVIHHGHAERVNLPFAPEWTPRRARPRCPPRSSCRG